MHVASIYYVGKESNFLEEVDAGILHDLDEVQQRYFDPGDDEWSRYVVPILKQMPRAELARLVGVSERYIQYLRNGKRPSKRTRDRLRAIAVDFAHLQNQHGRPR